MREIKVYPEPVLRKKAKPVVKVDNKVRQLLDEMLEIMYESKGIGLAAPQIGVSEQIIVIGLGENLIYKLINPKVIMKKGKSAIEEGCLSCPEVTIKVNRAKKVKVKAWNELGEEIILESGDLLATVLQHEIDHLNGKLIIDYVPWPKRWFVRQQLKQKGCVI